MIPRHRSMLSLPAAVATVLAATACGGSKTSSSPAAATTPVTTTQQTATTSVTTTQQAATTPASSGGRASVTAGPVRGVLIGANHAPTVGKLWRYSVKVTDAAGHPLSGTVDIEFTYSGVVVGHDKPPTHPLTNGAWSDRLTFPAQSAGQPLSVQAVAHTSAGSITLDWPVTVKQ